MLELTVREPTRWAGPIDPEVSADPGVGHLVFHAPRLDQERFLNLYAEEILARLRRLGGTPATPPD